MTIQLTKDEEERVLAHRQAVIRSDQELPIRKAVYAFDYVMRNVVKGEGDARGAQEKLVTALADLIHGEV